MNQLRAEADAANDRAEAAEAKNKQYEQQILELKQKNKLLQHRLDVLGVEHEAKLQDTALDGEQSKTSLDNWQRKVQLLEEKRESRSMCRRALNCMLRRFEGAEKASSGSSRPQLRSEI